MSKELPRFSTLAANYPDKGSWDTKKLLDAVGGPLRRAFNDYVNTCAIRMSWCLNKIGGQKIQRLAGIPMYEGQRPAPDPKKSRRQEPDLYVVSAQKMKDYLDRVYGPGSLIYDARKKPSTIALGGSKTAQGIIVFDWLGAIRDFGATGHVDLFRVIDNGPDATPQFVPACVGSCYWQADKQPMLAYLWDAKP